MSIFGWVKMIFYHCSNSLRHVVAKIFADIFCHLKAPDMLYFCFQWLTDVSGFPPNLFFMICHRFSIRFRLGPFPGHSSSSILLFLNHFKDIFYTWHRALSCWNCTASQVHKLNQLFIQYLYIRYGVYLLILLEKGEGISSMMAEVPSDHHKSWMFDSLDYVPWVIWITAWWSSDILMNVMEEFKRAFITE